MTGLINAAAGRPFRAFIIVGEESGDQLGAGLMRALREKLGGNVEFHGTGGVRMEAAGLRPLFSIGEVDVIGLTGVIVRLRRILRRIREAADAAIATDPDVLILVDSPEFTHRVARIVRRRAPHIPIIDYVSPSVWAWRSARARKMVPHIDQVLALLPFEPEVYVRLGGPPCVYVGHPLLEKIGVLRPAPGERRPIGADGRPPVLLVLPGSRHGEIKRLTAPFGKALAQIVERHGPVEAILPAVPHLVDEIRRRVADWPVKPTIVEGEAAKLAAFRRANAALAASGTVSLELALSGVPMVIAYRVERYLRSFRWMIKVPSIVLANVVMGDLVIPEYLDADCTPERLASAVLPLLRDSPERARQLEAFSRLDEIMAFDLGQPTHRAAELILEFTAKATRPPPPRLASPGAEPQPRSATGA